MPVSRESAVSLPLRPYPLTLSLALALTLSVQPLRSAAPLTPRALTCVPASVLEPKKMKWIFKHADRSRAQYVVLLAPREFEEGMVRIKCMEDGEQEDVPIASLAEVLSGKIAPAQQ